MSVLIKGMEMPNNCGACPLQSAWCIERIYMVTRPERCPLVPVPPHGDLIDRDSLMKNESPIKKMMMFGGQYVFSENEIKNAPIVIPAEEDE